MYVERLGEWLPAKRLSTEVAWKLPRAACATLSIVEQPESVSIAEGEETTLSVGVTGGDYKVTWYLDSALLGQVPGRGGDVEGRPLQGMGVAGLSDARIHRSEDGRPGFQALPPRHAVHRAGPVRCRMYRCAAPAALDSSRGVNRD